MQRPFFGFPPSRPTPGHSNFHPFGFGRANFVGGSPRPFMQRPGMIQRPGLIGRLFGRGMMPVQNRPFPFFPGGAAGQQVPQAGGIIGNLLGGGQSGGTNILGMLNNVQKVLNMAQQVIPVVQQFQQYGHLIKNIPAMIKMMKALNDVEENTEDTGEEQEKEEKEEEEQEEQNKTETDEKEKKNKETKKKAKKVKNTKNTNTGEDEKKEGISKPKLYI
jgi:hypothetical protein